MTRIMLVAFCLCVAGRAMCQVTPFSVCAHLGGGEEYADRIAELDQMQAAGIRSARADFTWGYFEPQKGKWQFEVYDKAIADAKARGVTLLPILCYNVDWAFPAQEHLADWCEYVRTVVTRYQGDLKHWEVWNEPNIEFWKPKPDAVQYTALLKATYETIKQVNPNLQVVYGGTAGIPFDYLRKSFEAGAIKSFDVLAVHPYRYPQSPDTSDLVEDLRKTRDLVTEFGGKQPIWITEYGWPTHVNSVVGDGSFPAALTMRAAKLRFPQAQGFKVAVLDEPDMPSHSPVGPLMRDALGRLPGVAARLVKLADLAGLGPQDTQVLVMPTSEDYPADYFDQMLRFVREGGLLVHVGGVPLYYASRLKDGKWERPGASDEARTALHVGWKAWWTEKGLPESADRTELALPGGEGLALPPGVKSTRWLTDAKLQGQDKFVPLLAAYSGAQLVGYPVALYLYDSELKGAFLTMCLDVGLSGVTEDTEAQYLPRALLQSLYAGVSNIYWYEFRDGGDDETYNECRFGIIHHDLKPKPAYLAYQALTRALGQARFLNALDIGPKAYCYLFKAGDTMSAAIWRATGEGPARFHATGANLKATDYLGNPVQLNQAGGVLTVTASEKVTYITGLKGLQIAR